MRDFWKSDRSIASTYTKGANSNSTFNIDGDTALILTLIILLKKEGADTILIMALLYIIS